jgi:hypothetical protein
MQLITFFHIINTCWNIKSEEPSRIKRKNPRQNVKYLPVKLILDMDGIY